MANKYSGIIDSITWSHSSLALYNQCPYAWFLKYIYRKPAVQNISAEFGKLIHSAIEEYFTNKTDLSVLSASFIKDFSSFCVRSDVRPEDTIHYIRIGTNYIKNLKSSDLSRYIDDKSICGIEKKEYFFVNGYRFVGIIDMLLNDSDKKIILDHKSYSLQNVTSGKAVGKYIDLHKYLIQQYLYAECVKQNFGEYPSQIAFNCFKKEDNQIVEVDFNYIDLAISKEWATSTIERIKDEDNWEHRRDYWFCRHICGYRFSCEYSDIRRK